MKIEIDLKEILSDEYGSSENLAQSIVRQVSDEMVSSFRKDIKAQFDIEINKVVKSEINEAIKNFIENGLDEEYQVVDNYGTPKEKTTLKKQIQEAVMKASTYKHATYSSERNPFTEKVNEIVKDLAVEATEEIRKTIDGNFKKKVLDDAIKTIRETLKL